jgi:hypothetical protein
MLNRLSLAVLGLLMASSAMAQLRVEISFEQETYLPKEPMNAVVRIYNSSGQTLVLGTNQQWLTFDVESADGSVVRQTRLPDIMGEFTLPSAHRAKKYVDLATAFDLSKFGRYYVTATVRIPEWHESFTSSKHAVVGISTGVKLWEARFGLPQPSGEGRPEIRKFQLVQANHLKELTLYLRITDETEAYTYSIYPLGALIGFSKPEPQLDKWSNLHVLYQDGAKSFRYNVVMPDGMILSRQTWEIQNGSRPELVVGEDGRIVVHGGVRRISASDLPPPELLSETSNFGSAIAAPLNSEHARKKTKNGKKTSN